MDGLTSRETLTEVKMRFRQERADRSFEIREELLERPG
jgi:hypothetical protein